MPCYVFIGHSLWRIGGDYLANKILYRGKEVDTDKLRLVEQYASTKIDLTSYIKSCGFKMTGNTMSCPFHGSDSTPSLRVNGDKWKCFGCGRGGGYLKFRLEQELIDNSKCTYYDVVERFVSETSDIAVEVGGTILKDVNESLDEQWDDMIQGFNTERRKPQLIEVKSLDKLICKATKQSTEIKLHLLSGIQDELPYNYLENIVNGTDITGMSLEDIAKF